MTQQGVPLTWPELLAFGGSNVDDTLEEGIPRVLKLMAETGDNDFFETLARNLARCVLCAGIDRSISMIKAAAQALAPALPDFRRGIDKDNCDAASGVLDFVNLLRCTGEPAPAEVDEAAWLAAISKFDDEFSEKRLNTLTLAALAAGQPELVPKLIGGGRLPKTFKPGETFQFNVQGFTRYMAVAMQHGAEAEDAGPAWGEFVAVFPRKLATDTLDWIDPFWATRAFMVHFEKRDAGEVAQSLYDYVRE